MPWRKTNVIASLRGSYASLKPLMLWRRGALFALGRLGSRCANARSSVSTTMAEEKDVGILCYVSTLPGFRGVLKHRYADFIVNEVNLDGNVVHLTDLEASPEDTKLEVPKVMDNKPTDAGFSVSDYEKQLEEFKALAGCENESLLRCLLEKVAEGMSDDAFATLLPDGDKAHRTMVHTFFREKLPCFVTDTVKQNGSDQSVRVRYNSGSFASSRGKRSRNFRGGDRDAKRQKQDSQFDSRGRDYWPPGRKRFCQFHLYKENRTTQSAIMMLAQKLGTKAKSFGFAGTKDKRAITTQRVTVFKYSATKLASVNKHLTGVKVGNFSYVEDGLTLGQLSGNRFTITLRDVVAESEVVIKRATESLKESGFVNYYGLQRFGNGGVATHAIGAKLLRGDWEGAIELILGPREGEQSAIEEARQLYRSKGAAEALSRMPHHMIAERSLLFGLKRDPGNLLQALDNIPRPMRMMYVHSYQSYLWNNAVSYRLEKYGLDEVVEGDLVYCHDEVPEVITNDTIENEVVDTDMLDDDAELEQSTNKRKKVKHVTKEDIVLKRYTIADVVLPLPGSTTVYPANDVANVYENLAQKDLVDLKSSPHKVKQFSMEHFLGSYRHIVIKPIDFAWKLLRYNDGTKPLANTDLDRMVQGDNAPEPDGDGEGNMLALQVEFTLPSSAYATMALRELLKMTTSVAVHKSLTQAHDKPAATNEDKPSSAASQQ